MGQSPLFRRRARGRRSAKENTEQTRSVRSSPTFTLHYVLDEWFENAVKPHLKGAAHEIRFADDAVLCFQYREDAEKVILHSRSLGSHILGTVRGVASEEPATWKSALGGL